MSQRGGGGGRGGGGRGGGRGPPAPYGGAVGGGGRGPPAPYGGGRGRGAGPGGPPPSPFPSSGGGGGGGSSVDVGRGRGAGLGGPPPYPSLATYGGGGSGSVGAGRGGAPPPPSPSPSPSPSQMPSSSASPSTPSSLAGDMESLSIEHPEATLEVVQAPASSKSVRFPSRPGRGTAGQKCVVRANHFLVSLKERDMHHYDVSISPEVTSRGVNRAVMKELVSQFGSSHLGNKKPVYDGRKGLFTAGPLPFKSKDFVITLGDKDEGTSKLKREREFKVSIKFAAKTDLLQLQDFLSGRQRESPQDIIQALDIVLRELPSNQYTVVGRSFFSSKLGMKSEVGDGLECWRGYYQSLRPTQQGLSLNIDVAATSFYEAISVVDFVRKLVNVRDPNRQLSDVDRTKIKKAIRGIRVELTHLNVKKRHKISGITTLPLNQLMFTVDDSGKQISVANYFSEKYGKKLNGGKLYYPHWPALQAGSDSKPTYLPMEVCKIVEGQRYSKKLNERQVTAILRAACQRPHERQENIDKMAKQNNYKADEFAKEFGVDVDDRLTVIQGARVLKPPMLKYHDTGREANIQPRTGQWNMMNCRMIDGATIRHWACVNFSRLPEDTVHKFLIDLVSMCNNRGLSMAREPCLPLRSSRPEQIERALIDLHAQSVSRIVNQEKLQLLVVILPDFTGSYGKIKRICETELGIISQCCQPKQVFKNNNQYRENLSMKINVKAGGRNTVLMDAINRQIPLVTDNPTIIFGADVTHPQPGEDTCPSIAAVVASMDWPQVTKYRCLVSAQQHRQEIIQDLYRVQQDPKKGTVHSGMIRELLVQYFKSTRQKPHRIIFYRDGVSEGQFNQVLLYELDAIRKACSSLEEGYLPPVTFVVVQKRHHTRLFPVDSKMTDRSGNILPGTVVDNQICHPSEFDFYLCSHAGIQGTSRPTHYHVLWDENKFSADNMQILTNNLCYTYARCTKSVSVVPPAYYAHLAAFRARYYIEGESSESGSDTRSDTRRRNAPVRALPAIMDNVKDVMFYC